MTTRAGRRGSAQPRRDFYGIAEIADALDLSRQLVTVWRRRRSHGLPEPDAELSSGPIWRGETIEPWIDDFRDRRDLPVQPLDAEVTLRACRRILRLAALLLEQPPRIRLLSQALAEVRELQSTVATSADDELGRAVRALLESVSDEPAGAEGGEALAGVRRQVLAVLPLIPDIVRISDTFRISDTVRNSGGSAIGGEPQRIRYEP